MKILIATHGHLADGIKSTLSLFVDVSTIECINAYVDDGDQDIESKIKAFMDACPHDQISIIFTDLLGGSVNQVVMRLLDRDEIKVIAGFNPALILEIMTKPIESEDELNAIIEQARTQMTLVKLDKRPVEINDDDFLA